MAIDYLKGYRLDQPGDNRSPDGRDREALPFHHGLNLPKARARMDESGNLPTELASFVGRTAELTVVGELLAWAPAITLTGRRQGTPGHRAADRRGHRRRHGPGLPFRAARPLAMTSG
ncbi:hypothetical protein [Nonomuraea endophytica]|uniref:Uncharacterized protein n=1 Tax=Nonomuraea endophytica TaxID=714136 RepID=A0A7W8A638_9ACTN|nr:hypothetical protein [Nonomuraea endophytica]MBB5079445.1 hypothetical protein [Nonomuraea endophytica]